MWCPRRASGVVRRSRIGKRPRAGPADWAGSPFRQNPPDAQREFTRCADPSEGAIGAAARLGDYRRRSMDLIWEAIRDATSLLVHGGPRAASVSPASPSSSRAWRPLLQSLIGIPIGIALNIGRFRGRGPATVVTNAGMGLPPVVVGLLVTLVLWRTGPLGALRLLFTPPAMMRAQVLVAAPLVAGFTRAAISLLDVDLAAGHARGRRRRDPYRPRARAGRTPSSAGGCRGRLRSGRSARSGPA